ncbi:hypothetical protein [Yoonia sp. SDW83-1]|uniref:hypothetical protein n=1 Tax=Yoonia sp. SDW83-1 TaxID=3366945 RepID=UPI00398C2CFE
MPTTKTEIALTWTALGAGPMAIACNRGRTWFWQGDEAPTDQRCGYLLSAQGQQRIVSFSQPDLVWARASDHPVSAIVITGTLSPAATPSTQVYSRYSDLPDPTTLQAGTFALVTADPIDSLNGMHVALGAAPGQPATFWAAAS